MSHLVNVQQQWRPVQRQFVNLGGRWAVVNRAYTNVNGQWRLSDVRTPGAVLSINSSVDAGSGFSGEQYQTTTQTSVTMSVSWTVATTDAMLPVLVVWMRGGVQWSSDSIPAGTLSAVRTIPVGFGVTGIYALVYVQNPVEENPSQTKYSAPGGSLEHVITRQVPSIHSVIVSPDYTNNALIVSWQAANVPPGYLYGVSWFDDLYYGPPYKPGITTGSGLTPALSASISMNGWYSMPPFPPWSGVFSIREVPDVVTFYVLVQLYNPNATLFQPEVAALGTLTLYPNQ